MMTQSVEPVPKGFHTITPYLVVSNAPKAIIFYEKAFAAKELKRLTDTDGRIRHAELEIGDSRLYLTDIPLAPETKIPGASDTSPVWLYMYVVEPDFVFERALEAGAEIVTPMGDQPWGDRYGCLRDPFGYRWGIAKRCEDLTQEQIEKRMIEAFGDTPAS